MSSARQQLQAHQAHAEALAHTIKEQTQAPKHVRDSWKQREKEAQARCAELDAEVEELDAAALPAANEDGGNGGD